MRVTGHKRNWVALVFALILGVCLICFILMPRGDSRASVSAKTEDHVSQIPPAPLLSVQQVVQKQAKQESQSSQTIPSTEGLIYDEKLSFTENLTLLKEYCSLHSNDPRLTLLLNSFVQSLIEHAKGQFVVLKDALEQQNGTAAFRNLLLACVVNSSGPTGDIADLVWKVALNSSEKVEVRRTAAYLAGQVEDVQVRSEGLYVLLAESDAQIVISALANSTGRLDENGYNLIKGSLIYSPDINLRVAAVSALGRARSPDSQVTLSEIVTSGHTSRDEAFSEASLPKRAAIPHLDMHNPDTYQLVKRIALDENEDPGVRAKAISRFTPTEFPEATDMLNQLLQRLDTDNTVSLRAVVDTLLTAPTPERLQTVRAKAERLADPQIRNLILRRIELATQGN